MTNPNLSVENECRPVKVCGKYQPEQIGDLQQRSRFADEPEAHDHLDYRGDKHDYPEKRGEPHIEIKEKYGPDQVDSKLNKIYPERVGSRSHRDIRGQHKV